MPSRQRNGALCKYPPAEPEALICEPLKAAEGAATAAPKFKGTSRAKRRTDIAQTPRQCDFVTLLHVLA